MPLIWQGDAALKSYDWHVFPDEAAQFKNPGDKGDAVSAYGCYDASIAMVTIGSIARRDPSGIASNARTREFLAFPRTQPVYDRATGTVSTTSFSQNQAWLLYIPISNYDGGEAAHHFTTRGDAYHFPSFSPIWAPSISSCWEPLPS